MMGTPIRLDPGTRHLLAWCVECPSWRTLSGTRPEAHRAAAAHMYQVHGDALQAARYRNRASQLDTPTED